MLAEALLALRFPVFIYLERQPDYLEADTNNQVGVQDMYDAYIEWFKTTGLRGQLGRKQFVYRMEALGIEKTTRNSEGYSFKEVKLR